MSGDEISQAAVGLFSLTGVTHEHGGAQPDAGASSANAVDEVADDRLRVATAHHLEHAGVEVLQRHIEVRCDSLMSGNAIEQATGIRFTELPMSPPKVLKALDEAASK